jgi:hypothetical protein
MRLSIGSLGMKGTNISGMPQDKYMQSLGILLTIYLSIGNFFIFFKSFSIDAIRPENKFISSDNPYFKNRFCKIELGSVY